MSQKIRRKNLHRLITSVVPRTSIRPTLIVPFVMQIVGIVGLVGYLSYQSGQSVVNALIIDIEEEISDRIDRQVLTFLDRPQILLRSALSALESGDLDFDNQQQLACFFFAQVKQPTLPPHLGYGDRRGHLISVEVEDEGEILLKIRNESTGEQREVYEMGDRCDRRKFIEKTDYDPRQRGWYKAGITQGKQSWSPLYRSVTTQEVEVSAAVPVYRDGEAIGVLYSELVLSEIVEFLKDLEIGISGQAFIMERSGAMVASSAGLPFDVEEGEEEERQPERLLATQSNQPLIREAARGLVAEFGEMSAIADKQEFVFDIEGDRLFVQIAPLRDDRGLDWQIVVAVPESDFLGEINANRRNTIVLSILAALAATFIGIITARWITAPILDLNFLAKKLAKGQWDKTAQIDRVDEVGQLARSFNTMAEQLRESFTTLEQRVEERTAELAKAKKAAEVANEAKSTFLANMNHELRTPLNAILGFAQILTRSQRLDPDLQDNVTTIYQSGEYLLELVNQILDLAKIEAGRASLHERNFDFYLFLDELEDMFQLRAEIKGLQLVCEREENLANYLRCDRLKLRQILVNLLSNAIKFTSEGKVILRVSHQSPVINQHFGFAQCEQPTLRLRSVPATNTSASLSANNQHFGFAQCEQPTTMTFEVEDTGMGIEPEDFPKLFEAFMQTRTGVEVREGTGLGLPLARQFITMMGGEITVISRGKAFTPPDRLAESLPVRGTIVRFSIDATPVQGADLDARDGDRHVIALEPGQPHYRILAADDRETNRKLLVKLLAPLGFEIQVARNGLEAVEIYEDWHPHLIFMDLQMPVMDGYEATQRIRAKIVEQAPAIIAITASILEEEQASLSQSSFDDFTRKPFHTTTIFDKLAKHLGVRYLYEEKQAITPKPIQSTLSEEEARKILKTVSRTWMSQMQDATNRLDEESIVQLIQKIEPQHPQLSKMLMSLSQTLRFDAILNLISDSEQS
ncbi:MAG: response regulator [Cyanobacteria bacterium SBLK]|nr:response regulator [Cyanobacteria bacterium SBLK]